jgi:hypothetical protein
LATTRVVVGAHVHEHGILVVDTVALAVVTDLAVVGLVVVVGLGVVVVSLGVVALDFNVVVVFIVVGARVVALSDGSATNLTVVTGEFNISIATSLSCNS